MGKNTLSPAYGGDISDFTLGDIGNVDTTGVQDNWQLYWDDATQTWVVKARDGGFRGTYATPGDLTTAVPEGVPGDWAEVLSTATVWVWSGGAWVDSGTSTMGDMNKAVYDPQNINADAFDRANHTGTQAISTISGLQAVLDSKVVSVTAGDATVTVDNTDPANPTIAVSASVISDIASKVQSVAAGDASITIGGTAVDPTISVSAALQSTIGSALQPGAQIPAGDVVVNPAVDGETDAQGAFENHDARIAALEMLGGGALPEIQVRTTVDIPVTDTPSFLPWNTTDSQNDPNVLELDPLDNTKILIKETGVYFIGQNFVHAAGGSVQVTTQVYVNGTTVLPGSSYTTNPTGGAGSAVTPTELHEFTMGDFIQIRAFTNTGTGDILADGDLFVFELRGVKGEKGDTGSGSNVTVEDNGINPTIADTINFINATITDAGGGTVDVEIPAVDLAPYFLVNGTKPLTGDMDAGGNAIDNVSSVDWLSELSRWTSANISVTGNTVINFDLGDDATTIPHITRIDDATYQLDSIGTYKISFKANLRKTNVLFDGDRRFDGAIQLDTGGGFADVPESYFQQLQYNAASDEGMVTVWAIVRVTVANTFQIRCRTNGNGGSTTVDSLGTALLIEYNGGRS